MAEGSQSNVLYSALTNDGEYISPSCCGSTTANADVDRKSTGLFERKASGGSFKVAS